MAAHQGKHDNRVNPAEQPLANHWFVVTQHINTSRPSLRGPSFTHRDLCLCGTAVRVYRMVCPCLSSGRSEPHPCQESEILFIAHRVLPLPLHGKYLIPWILIILLLIFIRQSQRETGWLQIDSEAKLCCQAF